MQTQIEEKLAGAIDLKHLEVVNESANHNVPPHAESHFKVILVADEFDGERPLDRHRRINRLLEEELLTGVHALSIHAYTVTEWQTRNGAAPMSPPCLHR